MAWPFKTIRPESQWVLKPVLLALAGTVIAVPPEHRAEATLKMVERGLRLAVRLANEFGVPPTHLHEMLDAVVADEAKSLVPTTLFGGSEKLSA